MTTTLPNLSTETATDAELLAVLREAAGVITSRKTPDRIRRWTVDYASRVVGPHPGPFGGSAIYNAKIERLEAVYDAHADELQALPYVTDPDAWTETQQWMRR